MKGLYTKMCTINRENILNCKEKIALKKKKIEKIKLPVLEFNVSVSP